MSRNRKHGSRMFGFEKKSEKLAPINIFVKRMLISLGLALGLIAVALAIGISGYHYIGGLGWIDAILEASMILGGMGPVNPLANDSIKIFASAYALFSGLIFIAIMGITLSPVAHRMLHRFHIAEEDEK
jgi:hypothetical protein